MIRYNCVCHNPKCNHHWQSRTNARAPSSCPLCKNIVLTLTRQFYSNEGSLKFKAAPAGKDKSVPIPKYEHPDFIQVLSDFGYQKFKDGYLDHCTFLRFDLNTKEGGLNWLLLDTQSNYTGIGYIGKDTLALPPKELAENLLDSIGVYRALK